MNKRIEELARQVWPDPNISHANHMKFAELIVRECVDAVDKTNTHHVLTTFDDGLVRSTMAKTKTAIKEHFGLE